MSGQRPAHLAGVLLRHAENGLAWPSQTAFPSPSRAHTRLARGRTMHRRDPGAGSRSAGMARCLDAPSPARAWPNRGARRCGPP